MPPEHHAPATAPSDESGPSPAQPPWTGWLSPLGLSLGILGLTVLTFYYKLWWPGRLLVRRDAILTFLPVKQYMIDRLRSGELPEWFPYDALGTSFIGVTVSGIFHPFTALYFFLPVHEAYRLSALLSCLLGAAGAFALGRCLQLSHAGAVLAGIGFACSGYVASVTENVPYLYALCLAPFFLAALEKTLSGHSGWLVAPAVLWASVFLNGDIQTGYYFAFIALLWVTMRAPGQLRHAWLRVAVVTVLAGLLAGVQLGPTLSMYLGSNRRALSFFQGAQFDWATWSTHPLRLLSVVAWPNSTQADPGEVMRVFFGGPTMASWAESLYLGLPVMGLALLGVRQRRDLRVLAVLGALALVLMLGRYGGLYDVLRHVVPFWSAFRIPEKFMGFVSLFAALLAGAGLDAIRGKRSHQAPWFAAAFLCVGAAGLLRAEFVQRLIAGQYAVSMEFMGDIAGTSAQALLMSGAAALGVGLLILAARHGSLRTTMLTLGLVAIVALDLMAANMRAYFTGPRAIAEFVPPFVQALQSREKSLQPGHFRIATQLVGTKFLSPAPLEDALGVYGASAVYLRHAFHALNGSLYHVENLVPWLPGYHPALETFVAPHPVDAAYARFNVAYFVKPRLLPFMKQRFLDKLVPELTESDLALSRVRPDLIVSELPEFDLVLVRNPVPAKPRAYFSGRPEKATGPVGFPALFARPDFLEGTLDVIETPEALPGAMAGGQVVVERYEPEQVVIRTASPAPAVLVLVDAFDPGWRATLETGEGLPVRRANLLMRAVVVPAGEHRVTFLYRTPLLAAGAWASAAGLALCLALLAFPRRRAHPPQPEEPGDVPITAR